MRDGAAAERELRAQPYTAAVLDLGLPLLDGLLVLQRVRQAGVRLPVLVLVLVLLLVLLLTARDALPDRISGLDSGADDDTIKPVDLDELAARLRALVRRAAGRPQALLQAGALQLDSAARSVRLNGLPVALSTRQFERPASGPVDAPI